MANNFSALADLLELDPKKSALQSQLDALDRNVDDYLSNNGW